MASVWRRCAEAAVVPGRFRAAAARAAGSNKHIENCAVGFALAVAAAF
jgi:hypothetical protein